MSKEYLRVLESAISDVGCWTWWTTNDAGDFQVEFSGVQLWNPPLGVGRPPSGQIALRFRNIRQILFLTFNNSIARDWPDRLQRDELKPFDLRHDSFTLTSSERLDRSIAKAISVRRLDGESNNRPSRSPGDSMLALDVGPVGLVVTSASIGVFNHQGELDSQAVISASEQWWTYWTDYWKRKDSSEPMPLDYACEATIPAGP